MTPTAEQLAKLPKWAQEHIESLTRQRENSILALNEFTDKQTPSPFFVSEYVSNAEGSGTFKTNYIQTHKMEVNFSGVHLTIVTNDLRDGIVLQWGSAREGRIGIGCADVAFIPSAYQSAKLVSQKEMRK